MKAERGLSHTHLMDTGAAAACTVLQSSLCAALGWELWAGSVRGTFPREPRIPLVYDSSSSYKAWQSGWSCVWVTEARGI